jgi:DNA-binding NarL/FixJ family response regulator
MTRLKDEAAKIFMFSNPIRLLIADDHELVRTALVTLLELDGDIQVVASVGRSDQAQLLAAQTQPDVALLDYTLPPQDGVAVALALQTISPSTRVLILTGTQQKADIVRIKASPALGALHKTADSGELKRAIWAVHEGDVYFSRSMAALLGGDLPANNNGLETLTERERVVMRWVVSGETSQSIADRLCVHRDTIRTHRRNLMVKLNVHNIAQLTTLAISAGGSQL